MLRIPNEEDALDGIRTGTTEPGESVDGCSGALRVALQDEALGGTAGEGGCDVVDNLCRIV